MGKGMLNVAKVQYKLRLAFGLNLPWYGNMEWNMEENFSMEWKIFTMELKKIASSEYGKIIFHFIPRPASRATLFLARNSRIH